MHILIAQSEPRLAAGMVRMLGEAGHCATSCPPGADPLKLLPVADVVILDLDIERTGDLTLLSRIRSTTDAPLLVLCEDQASTVRGLDAGAEHFVKKPIIPREFLERTQVACLLARKRKRATERVRIGDVVVDFVARALWVGDRLVTLTTTEFDILAVIARKPGAAISRRQIMSEVWGEAGIGVSRSLDVHIVSLRNKIGQRHLFTTIRGYGYRFDVPPSAVG